VVEPLNRQPHLKSKVQSGDSDSNSVSDEEGQEDASALKCGTHAFGVTSTAKRLPPPAKSPLQAALQAARSQRGFTLCLRDWILTALAYNRDFKTTP
jgi:hypothetical protein